MTMQKVSAVVFDWGGVLMDDPLPPLINYCSERLGVSAEALDRIYTNYLPQFQTAAIDEIQFWRAIAHDLGVATPQPATLWGDGFKAIYAPRENVFAWAAQLQRAGITTALLSNTEMPVAQFFKSQGYTMFDHPVLSCEEGTRKPERKIFEILLERITVPEAQAVYVDDVAEYVAAGKAMGINSHQVQSAADIERVLRSYELPIK